MRQRLGDLADGQDPAFLAEALEDAEGDLVGQGCAPGLLGALLGQELGDRPAHLGATGHDDLFAQQLVIVVHLVPGPAVMAVPLCALPVCQRSDRGRRTAIFGLQFLTKVVFGGLIASEKASQKADPRGQR